MGSWPRSKTRIRWREAGEGRRRCIASLRASMTRSVAGRTMRLRVWRSARSSSESYRTRRPCSTSPAVPGCTCSNSAIIFVLRGSISALRCSILPDSAVSASPCTKARLSTSNWPALLTSSRACSDRLVTRGRLTICIAPFGAWPGTFGREGHWSSNPGSRRSVSSAANWCSIVSTTPTSRLPGCMSRAARDGSRYSTRTIWCARPRACSTSRSGRSSACSRTPSTRAAFLEGGLEVVDATGNLFGYGLYVCQAVGSRIVEKG